MKRSKADDAINVHGGPTESIAEPRLPNRSHELIPVSSRRFDHWNRPLPNFKDRKRRVLKSSKPFFLKRDSSPSSDSIMSLPSWGSSSSSSDETVSKKLDTYKSSARAYFSPFFKFTRKNNFKETDEGVAMEENGVPLPFLFTTLMQAPVSFRNRRGMLPGADIDANVSFYRRMEDDKHDPLLFKVGRIL